MALAVGPGTRQFFQSFNFVAEAQAKTENAAAEAKSENTEAAAEEVEGTCTGTMVNDGVETTGEVGGRHPGLHTVNEEAGHIVSNTEHVEHDMNDDTGERTKTMHNGEQTEIVIENENAEAQAEEVNDAVEATGGAGEEHSELSMVIEEPDYIVGEVHHARCVHSDEEAGSVVLHVSRDMNEKEKEDEEASETAAAKETEEVSKEDVEFRRRIEERRNTPKEETQRLKEVSKCRNVSETKKNEKTAIHP